MYLLVEMQGQEGDQSAMERWLSECLDDPGVEDGVVAFSQTQIDVLWSLREGLDKFWTKATPHGYVSFDVGVKSADLDRFVTQCREGLLAISNAPALFFGHIGDGNVHVVAAIPGEDSQGAKARIEASVYSSIADFAGTISAEHGVGCLKQPWLHVTRSSAELDVMRRLKDAFDPLGLLNPGKVLSRHRDVLRN